MSSTWNCPQVGDRVEQGEAFGEVESTKSVSELFAPVSGVVAEVNDELAGAPQRLNEDPYGDGWICTVTFDDVSRTRQPPRRGTATGTS